MATKHVIVAVILACVLVSAQEYPFDASLYDAREITVQLQTSGDVTLSGNGNAQRLEASVQYVPEEAVDITAEPQPETTNPLVFVWRNAGEGTYSYSYTTTVHNTVEQPRVTQLIPYPFSSPETVTAYLVPQEITDTNPTIRAQARAIVGNTSDAMEAVFRIATWVNQNVKYDLNSVTAQASKPSSWVYQHREGVCDELTSLFITMSREAGIPARFVSGYAYTNLDQFPNHWGPHGWAEVWLPEVGWMPVDVTYGQIGYVDATHVSIKHSLDAKTTAVEYELLANGMLMHSGELTTEANVLSKEGSAAEPLVTTLTSLYRRTGSKSGNLLRATVRNNARYYVATEVYLATTPDTKLLDNKRQQVLLPPQSSRTISWRAVMPEYESGFRYTVPFTAIVQRAGNASTTVEGGVDAPVYPQLEKETAEQTSVAIDCEQPPVLYIGEKVSVECVSMGSRLCAGICIKDRLTLSYEAKEPGAFPTVVSATKGSETGTSVVTFIVEQHPQPSISISMPQTAKIEDVPTLSFTVNTNVLTDAKITASSKRFSHDWTVDKLDAKGFELRFPATYLSAGENEITVTVSGKDKNGQEVRKTATATIDLQVNLWQRLQLLFIHVFA